MVGVFSTTVGERVRNHAKANKLWRDNNREKYRALARKNAKEWAENNPEAKKQIRKREYQKNREKYAARTKAWREANRERSRLYYRNYYKKQKLLLLSPKCINCESILKFEEISICAWCVKTYNLIR